MADAAEQTRPKDMTPSEKRAWERERKKAYRRRKREEAKRKVAEFGTEAQPTNEQGQSPSGQDARPTREGQPQSDEDKKRKQTEKARQTKRAKDSVERSRAADPEVVDQMRETITARVDGRNKGATLSPEFKAAIQETYAGDLGLDTRALATACGVTHSAIISALQEAPTRYDQARQKRQLATVEDLEQGLAELARRFRDNAASGELEPSAKNMRDFSILFGVMVDKLRLMTGQSTENMEVRAHLTLDERKSRLGEVLERAGRVIDQMPGE